jgi:hypothetical protein
MHAALSVNKHSVACLCSRTDRSTINQYLVWTDTRTRCVGLFSLVLALVSALTLLQVQVSGTTVQLRIGAFSLVDTRVHSLSLNHS